MMGKIHQFEDNHLKILSLVHIKIVSTVCTRCISAVHNAYQKIYLFSLSNANFCLLNLLDGSVFVVATPSINAFLHVSPDFCFHNK